MDEHGFTAEVGDLHGFGAWFRDSEDIVAVIGDFTSHDGARPIGAGCPSLRPIAVAMPGLADAVAAAFTELRARVLAFGSAVCAAADDYAEVTGSAYRDEIDIWPPRLAEPDPAVAEPVPSTAALDWFWAHFVAGESLDHDLCAPVRGDFAHVRATGLAWRATAAMLSELGVNMDVNARKLAGGTAWTSVVADQIRCAVSQRWLPTLTAMREICQLVGTGFLAVADAAATAEAEIADLVPPVTARIERLATTAYPTPDGTDVPALEWDVARHGAFPGRAEVDAILVLIGRARTAVAGVAAAVAVAKSYVDLVAGLASLASTLPSTVSHTEPVAYAR
jgi:hypothetical protein